MSVAGLALLVALLLWAVMTAAWLVQRRTGNSGWVDVSWSFGTGLAGVGFALAPLDGAQLDGAPLDWAPLDWVPPGWRQCLVGLLVAAWSLRLGLHIAGRAAKGVEDPRYAALHDAWGADFPRRLYLFLMLQGVVAFGLAVSMGLAARNPSGFGVLDAAGIVVLGVAILGEGVADAQLRRFKADPANAGLVCDAGLWAWSRHPNYFFEFLAWVAYPLFALSGGWAWGWIALSGPALMYWTLRHASGVPPLEEHMARRYGERFRAYAARVPVFFPRPPRSDAPRPDAPRPDAPNAEETP